MGCSRLYSFVVKMFITKLPNELLDKVLYKLDFQDTVQCSWVNKPFYLVSLRYTFKSIKIDSFDSKESAIFHRIQYPFYSACCHVCPQVPAATHRDASSDCVISVVKKCSKARSFILSQRSAENGGNTYINSYIKGVNKWNFTNSPSIISTISQQWSIYGFGYNDEELLKRNGSHVKDVGITGCIYSPQNSTIHEKCSISYGFLRDAVEIGLPKSSLSNSNGLLSFIKKKGIHSLSLSPRMTQLGGKISSIDRDKVIQLITTTPLFYNCTSRQLTG